MIPIQQSSLRMFWKWTQMFQDDLRDKRENLIQATQFFRKHHSREHRGVNGWLVWGRIFRPWHIRCRMGWGPPLPAVQAPVWWQTSRLGWTDQGESGLVTGHIDAPRPLCTLQCRKNIHVVHSTCWRKATDIRIYVWTELSQGVIIKSNKYLVC